MMHFPHKKMLSQAQANPCISHKPISCWALLNPFSCQDRQKTRQEHPSDSRPIHPPSIQSHPLPPVSTPEGPQKRSPAATSVPGDLATACKRFYNPIGGLHESRVYLIHPPILPNALRPWPMSPFITYTWVAGLECAHSPWGATSRVAK